MPPRSRMQLPRAGDRPPNSSGPMPGAGAYGPSEKLPNTSGPMPGARAHCPSGPMRRLRLSLLLLPLCCLLLLPPRVGADCVDTCTPGIFQDTRSQCVTDCEACMSKSSSDKSCVNIFDPNFDPVTKEYQPDWSSCTQPCFSKVPWWGWLIAGIIGLLVFGSIVACCVVCYRRSQANNEARAAAAAAAGAGAAAGAAPQYYVYPPQAGYPGYDPAAYHAQAATQAQVKSPV